MIEIELGLLHQMAVVDALEISKNHWPSERVRDDRRLVGFMGEAAASIFLTNNLRAWTNGFESWKNCTANGPDLHDFPGIEVKTLPETTHRLVPLAAPFKTAIQDCTGFLVMRHIAGVKMACIGWITKEEAERKYRARPRHLPSGTPAILAEELGSAETCPWIRRDVAAT